MRPIRLIAILVPLVLIAGAGGAWWWVAVGQHPLRGVTHHDFGWVDFAYEGSKVEHTYRLENRSGAPVTLLKVQPMCSCVQVQSPAPATVEPGGTLEIAIEMGFDAAGHKKKRIALVLDGHDPMNLWAEGTGRRGLAVRAMAGAVRVEPGVFGVLTLQAEVQGNSDKPPEPEITVRDTIDVRFAGWEEVTSTGEGDRLVVRWRGRIEVLPDADIEFRPGAEMGVVVGGAQPLTIMLLGPAE